MLGQDSQAAGRVAGDPLGEARALIAIQNAIGEPGSGSSLPRCSAYRVA